MEEVFAAVGGQPKLGEHDKQRLLARRFAHELERGLEVVLRIADADHRRRDRQAGEAVAVEVEEVPHEGILRSSVVWCARPYMLLLWERVVTHDGMLEIELHDDLRYRLSWRGVVYDRKRRYDFRSVEQLRYDFERDVEKA